MVVNVANLGRKPYIPLSTHVNMIMHELGFYTEAKSFGTNQQVQDHPVLGDLSSRLQTLA